MKINDPWWIEKLPELMKIAPTQNIYNLLIASKNEWNNRAIRGETDNSERLLKRAYLHFLVSEREFRDPCACGESNRPGTHAEFACTIRKS